MYVKNSGNVHWKASQFWLRKLFKNLSYLEKNRKGGKQSSGL